MNFSIETLWDEVNFKPNKSQEQAIKHIDGQEIAEALKRYCELDTLAMVMIYEHLKSIV
jgi:enhancing lycopene biosynthesis protein 2